MHTTIHHILISETPWCRRNVEHRITSCHLASGSSCSHDWCRDVLVSFTSTLWRCCYQLCFPDEQARDQRLGDLAKFYHSPHCCNAWHGSWVGALQMGQVQVGEGEESPWPRPLSSLAGFTILHSAIRVICLPLSLEWVPGRPLFSLSLSFHLCLSLSASLYLPVILTSFLFLGTQKTPSSSLPQASSPALLHLKTLLSQMATVSAPLITQHWLPCGLLRKASHLPITVTPVWFLSFVTLSLFHFIFVYLFVVSPLERELSDSRICVCFAHWYITCVSKWMNAPHP